MSFSEQDYQTAADSLGVDVARVKGIAEVESSGNAFSTVNSQKRPVIRLEAHWFGKLTGYKYNESHPHISCRAWTPKLAAKNQTEAWNQFSEAADLDEGAAIQATSWGAFQIMGFHWKALGYTSPQEMRADMESERGQMEAFVRFIKANPAIEDALQRGDYEAFENGYNGGGFGGAYARKIEAAVARHGGV